MIGYLYTTVCTHCICAFTNDIVVYMAGEGWKPWDYAAGTLLVEEAGGCISSIDGSAFDLYAPSVLAASTVSLQREMVSVIAGVGSMSGVSAEK